MTQQTVNLWAERIGWFGNALARTLYVAFAAFDIYLLVELLRLRGGGL